MAASLGHAHPEICTSIAESGANLSHVFAGMLTEPLLRLANRLTSVLPPELDRVMFPSTGGESNEAAIKLAKTFTGNFEVVSLGGSWHGMTPSAQAAQTCAGRTGSGRSKCTRDLDAFTYLDRTDRSRAHVPAPAISAPEQLQN
jgi:4-aminobutyrate aminotransferase-like enzyme